MNEGSGRALIIAVGEQSEWGRTMALVRTEAEPTPLQVKLGGLAGAIGKIGLAVGALAFIVLMIRCVTQTSPAWCLPCMPALVLLNYLLIVCCLFALLSPVQLLASGPPRAARFGTWWTLALTTAVPCACCFASWLLRQFGKPDWHVWHAHVGG